MWIDEPVGERVGGTFRPASFAYSAVREYIMRASLKLLFSLDPRSHSSIPTRNVKALICLHAGIDNQSNSSVDIR